MATQQNRLIRFAMEYGLVLGVYFILKFIISVSSLHTPLLSIAEWVLMLGIPFLLYGLLRFFRDRQNGGILEFGNAWSLGMMLIFFASLPEALSQYIYCDLINPTYISDKITFTTQALDSLSIVKENPQSKEYVETLKQADIPSAIQYAVNVIFTNIFFGGFISLVVAMAVRRNPERMNPKQ